MSFLARFLRDGRNVNDKKQASIYAPTLFAAEPEAKEKLLSKDHFADAMRRLFSAGKIHVITYGKPSNPHTKIMPKELPI